MSSRRSELAAVIAAILLASVSVATLSAASPGNVREHHLYPDVTWTRPSGGEGLSTVCYGPVRVFDVNYGTTSVDTSTWPDGTKGKC